MRIARRFRFQVCMNKERNGQEFSTGIEQKSVEFASTRTY
jgi:hypothetical protein